MLTIAPGLIIDESEIDEKFVRASGPGGQNVNKVATAVELRFDPARSAAVSPDMLARLRTIAGARMTADGVLVIQARRHRTQAQNRADARERLLVAPAPGDGSAPSPPKDKTNGCRQRATRAGQATAIGDQTATRQGVGRRVTPICPSTWHVARPHVARRSTSRTSEHVRTSARIQLSNARSAPAATASHQDVRSR